MHIHYQLYIVTWRVGNSHVLLLAQLTYYTNMKNASEKRLICTLYCILDTYFKKLLYKFQDLLVMLLNTCSLEACSVFFLILIHYVVLRARSMLTLCLLSACSKLGIIWSSTCSGSLRLGISMLVFARARVFCRSKHHQDLSTKINTSVRSSITCYILKSKKIRQIISKLLQQVNQYSTSIFLLPLVEGLSQKCSN